MQQYLRQLKRSSIDTNTLTVVLSNAAQPGDIDRDKLFNVAAA